MVVRNQNNIPEVDVLEERFNFIENEILRTNLAISFQYLIFMISLEEERKLPGPISYSLYKNMVIYTATIVESTLHYCLVNRISNGIINEETVMPKEDKYRNKKVLHEIEGTNEKVVGAIYSKNPERLRNKTQFQTINKACKRGGILDEPLFEEVEDLRNKRNRIHLAGLEEVDDYYEKRTAQTAFETAKKVIDRVEELVTEDQED